MGQTGAKNAFWQIWDRLASGNVPLTRLQRKPAAGTSHFEPIYHQARAWSIIRGWLCHFQGTYGPRCYLKKASAIVFKHFLNVSINGHIRHHLFLYHWSPDLLSVSSHRRCRAAASKFCKHRYDPDTYILNKLTPKKHVDVPLVAHWLITNDWTGQWGQLN